MQKGNKLNSLEAGTLLGILERGKRTILIWVGLFAILGVALNVLMPPVYRATTRLEIRKPPDRSPLTGQSFASSGFQSENVTMYTAAQRIKDRELLGGIATEFGPQGWIRSLPNAVPGEQGLTSRFQWTGVASAKALTPPSPPLFQRNALESQVDWLQSIVAVEPVQDTRLVDIRVEHHDPQAARTIADRLAQRFIEDQCRHAADVDTSGLVYLTAQLASMRAGFNASTGAPDANGLEGPAVLQSRIRSLGDAAAALNTEFLKVHSERVGIKTRLDKLATSDAVTMDMLGVSLTEDGALGALQRDLENSRVQLAAARQIYKDKHPRLMSLESQYASLQESFRAEQQRAAARLKQHDVVLAAQELSAKSSCGENERALRTLEVQFERSTAAHSEIKAQQDLYGVLVAKIQQSRVEALLRSRPVEIVNAANVAPHPVRPRKALNLAVCLMTGLLFGSGQVLVRSSSRNTVRTPGDVEAQLNLPLLGVVPKRDRD